VPRGADRCGFHFGRCFCFYFRFGSLFHRRLPNSLAQHRRVIPAKAQLGVAGKTAERFQRVRLVIVVIQKDVAFLAFDQRQHIDVLRHACSPERLDGIPATGALPTIAVQ